MKMGRKAALPHRPDFSPRLVFPEPGPYIEAIPRTMDSIAPE